MTSLRSPSSAASGICRGRGRVGVEGLAPGGARRVIDLAEVEHRTLRDAATVEPLVFDDGPVSGLLATLLAKPRA